MPALSEKSKEIYSNANKRLATALSVEALTPELLADSKKIIEAVESLKKRDDKPLGTEAKKGHYNALMSLLPKGEALWNTYSEKVRSYNKLVAEAAKTQALTEREAGKWLSWEEILAVREKLKPKDGEWDWTHPAIFYDYQDWVILCLYTMMPPLRVDFADMAVVEEVPAETAGNFLVLSSTKNCFVLQEYKTAGTYGRVEFDIPGELLDVLHEFLIYNPTGWLLVKTDGEPMSPYNLSQRMGRIMERASGKTCGITMFRHAYKTWLHKGEPTILNAEAEAKKMLHSPHMAQQYRRPEKE